jgi:hypothetical protein
MAAVMSGTRLSRVSLETSCVACRQTYLSCGKAVSGSFHPCNLATTSAAAQGLSRESGWKEGTATPRSSFNRHIKCANGRRRRHLLQIVQQAASPTLNSPENVATKNLQVSPLPDITSLSTRKAVVGSPPPSISKPLELQTKISLAEIVAPVAEDLVVLNNNLQSVVGAQNPLLMSAAKQIFGAGGKRMRPALIFLVSKATAELAGLKYLLLSHLYCSSHQYANIIQLLNISLCD